MFWPSMVVNQREGIVGFNDVIVVRRTTTWLLSKQVMPPAVAVMVED